MTHDVNKTVPPPLVTHDKAVQPNAHARPYTCTLCNRGFTDASYLRTHMRVHDDVKTRVAELRSFLASDEVRNASKTFKTLKREQRLMEAQRKFNSPSTRRPDDVSRHTSLSRDAHRQHHHRVTSPPGSKQSEVDAALKRKLDEINPWPFMLEHLFGRRGGG